MMDFKANATIVVERIDKLKPVEGIGNLKKVKVTTREPVENTDNATLKEKKRSVQSIMR